MDRHPLGHNYSLLFHLVGFQHQTGHEEVWVSCTDFEFWVHIHGQHHIADTRGHLVLAICGAPEWEDALARNDWEHVRCRSEIPCLDSIFPRPRRISGGTHPNHQCDASGPGSTQALEGAGGAGDIRLLLSSFRRAVPSP